MMASTTDSYFCENADCPNHVHVPHGKFYFYSIKVAWAGSEMKVDRHIFRMRNGKDVALCSWCYGAVVTVVERGAP